jgi:hypothetical protein
MPITVDWGDFEETILIWKIEGSWNIEDYLTARDDALQMVQQRAAVIVDVIADLRRSALLPQNIAWVIRDSLEVAQFNRGVVAVITPTSYWTQLVKTLQKTYFRTVKFSIYFVNTVDEAYALADAAQTQRSVAPNS